VILTDLERIERKLWRMRSLPTHVIGEMREFPIVSVFRDEDDYPIDDLANEDGAEVRRKRRKREGSGW